MCGIVAIRALKDFPELTSLGLRALDAIAHRGPDHTGWKRRGPATAPVFLGHQRLSILDLSPSANQPLVCKTTGNTLVFNGEIYNFLELRSELERLGEAFSSDTDSEVVLKGWQVWKEGVFARLNGMWAMAIHDQDSGDLILCRDRMGVKPLYLHHDGKLCMAASEIKAIAAALGGYPRPNLQAVFDFLLTGYADHDAQTFYEGIVPVPPSFFLRLTPTGRITQHRYHTWPETDIDQETSPDGIRTLLEDSIRLRLRSDVQVVSLLSGGLDSSIVTAIASKVHEPRTAYSGAFTYGYLNQADYDEIPSAQSLLSEIAPKTPHFIHRVENALPSFNELLSLARTQDEPFNTISILASFRTYDLLRQQGIKVVLSSEGADEVFGGYPHPFQALRVRDHLRTFDVRSAASMLRNGATDLSKLATTMIWGLPRTMVRSLLRNYRPSAALISQSLWHDMQHRFDEAYGVCQKPAEIQMRDWVTRFVLPHILRMADRNSMRVGLEVRSPFLDYRLVETGMAMPITQKLAQGETKISLRQAARGILPDAVARKRKTLGFGHFEQTLVARLPLDELWERLPQDQAEGILSVPGLRALLATPAPHPTLWWAISVLLWLACLVEENRALQRYKFEA